MSSRIYPTWLRILTGFLALLFAFVCVLLGDLNKPWDPLLKSQTHSASSWIAYSILWISAIVLFSMAVQVFRRKGVPYEQRLFLSGAAVAEIIVVLCDRITLAFSPPREHSLIARLVYLTPFFLGLTVALLLKVRDSYPNEGGKFPIQ